MSRSLGPVFGLIASAGLWTALHADPQGPATPPTGPFGLSLVTTPKGSPVDVETFIGGDTCGVCHEREWKEVQGSLHLASHTDPFYRGFAELARKEAGDKTYAYCSGCHSPAGVVSGLIPKVAEKSLPAEAKMGVTCDVCHQVTALTGHDGPWKEPGNASFVLQPGRVKFAATGTFQPNRAHSGEKRDFFAKAEFCASCHTVIHPTNGLRVETTYHEWKGSVYAEKGIQCQDCHMRLPEEVKKVAEGLQPVPLKGKRVVDGEERDIGRHFFVGGNANADRLAGGKVHAAMAEGMLKAAARLEIKAPAEAVPGDKLPLEAAVHNVAAGHNLPTGATELRQMWVEVKVTDAQGKVLAQGGVLDDKGELPADVTPFGAVAVDAAGKPTLKPWEMTRLTVKNTIPPKGSAKVPLAPTLPADATGPVTVTARLLYRSASPAAVALAQPAKPFTSAVTEMARAEAKVALKGQGVR